MMDHEWHSYDAPLWSWIKIKLPNGRAAKSLESIMRRRAPDGSWQYREMTAQEIRDQRDNDAW
jgi:hypothetical protein